MDRMLLIGLGNPGTEYENTYHNVGARALGAIAASLARGTVSQWNTHKKLFIYTEAGGLIFAKPLIFMNVSGSAVREAARKFHIPPERIILLHDDSDLPLGTWKISCGRGAAGHHGVESVIAALGTNDFARVRIGIRPANERTRSKAGTFVLRKATKNADAIFKKTFKEIAEKLRAEIQDSGIRIQE
jgi:PTH1 family peptidyl-tRNA hydrolase